MFAALVPLDLAPALIGAALSIIGAILGQATQRAYSRQRAGQTLDDRVDRLTRALRESSRIVGEIEREIATRHQAVEKLRQEQELLELDRDQIEAVAQTLRGELQREGRKAFWLGALQNMVFFGLGVGVTVLLG